MARSNWKFFGAIIWLSISSTCMSAYSAEQNGCSTIRLDKKRGVFEKIPIYNQKRYATRDTDICYAITAAELIDAHRLQGGATSLTSPFSVALIDKEKTYKKISTFPIDPGPTSTLLDGGFPDEAVNFSQGKEVCDHDWIERFAKLTGPHLSSDSLVEGSGSSDQFIKDMFDSVAEWRSAQSRVNSQMSSDGQPVCREQQTPLGRNLLGDNFTEMNALQRALDLAVTASDPTEESRKFFQAFCASHRHIVKTGRAKSFVGKANAKLEKQIGNLIDQLNNGKKPDSERSDIQQSIYLLQAQKDSELMPSKLRMANKIIGGAKAIPFAVSFRPGILNGQVTSEPGGFSHTSVVVGRRFNGATNKCEFLLRNSYGPGCIDHTSGNPYVFPCESGQIWIPSDVLFSNTDKLIWIPN